MNLQEQPLLKQKWLGKKKKVAWLLPEQEEYADVFKNNGWTVLLSSEEININVFGGTVNEE